jgi:hypothetical protein
LNINFSKTIQDVIQAHSSYSNPVEGDVHSIKRNSSALIKKWKYKLTEVEIRKIREGVEPISEIFYSPDDW